MNSSEQQQLADFINRIHALGDADAMAFTKHWQGLTLKRKTMLTIQGEKERYLYFVVEGVQRAFYMDDENREATIIFTYPYSFGGIADSFLTQTPSKYYYETITASRLLRISHETLQQAVKANPDIQEMLFKATAYALKGALERQVELQCYTNEEKFKTLLQRSPHILNLVPHKYLASYIGIDATNFSKLLSTVRI